MAVLPAFTGNLAERRIGLALGCNVQCYSCVKMFDEFGAILTSRHGKLGRNEHPKMYIDVVFWVNCV